MVVKKKKKAHPVLLKVGLSLLTVVLVGGIVFTTYYFTMSKSDSSYIDSLYTIKVDVDKYNDQAANATEQIEQLTAKDTKSLEDIRLKFVSAIYNMNRASQELQKLKPPVKYKEQFDNYSNGVYNNKRIYSQVNLILKNPKSSKMPTAISTLGKFIVDTSNYYEQGKLKKAAITLPNPILKIAETIESFTSKSYADYERKSRNLENNITYFKKMDSIITGFNTAKVNLAIYYNQLKAESTTFDEVYGKIEAKLSELAQVSTGYEGISIPSTTKIKETHVQFDDIIKRYIYYCQDFNIAITRFEEAGVDDAALADAAMTFDDLEVKYKALSKAYLDYVSSYNADKTKYSNIDNLK